MSSVTKYLNNSFADQFEPDGSRFIYRKNNRGPAIPVSQDERDGFVSEFKARTRYVTWGIPLLVLAVSAIIAVLIIGYDSESPHLITTIYVTMGIMVFIPFPLQFWIWNAPSRALDRRSPIGEARSFSETQRLHSSKISYRTLLLSLISPALLLFNVNDITDPSDWLDMGFLISAIALFAFALLQIFRKWWLERDDKSRNDLTF